MDWPPHGLLGRLSAGSLHAAGIKFCRRSLQFAAFSATALAITSPSAFDTVRLFLAAPILRLQMSQ
jgi:hypothetical protein